MCNIVQERYNEAESQVKTTESDINTEMATYNSLESDQASLRQVANAKKRLVSFLIFWILCYLW